MATMSFNPQTPQSPSQFSPSTADQGSSMNTSMTSITTSLPTPAHSVNGSTQPGDTTMAEDGSHKRKYPFDDTGDRAQKKVHLGDPRRIGIDNLHMDVGEKYLLCRTPHSASIPRMTEDLFEKFSLTGIAADVARVKPNGEKNALRKTYKGQIKSLGLSGHFDAAVKKDDGPGSIMQLVGIAEEDWQNRVVMGREIERGFSQIHQASLIKAMTMARGPVPKSAWDSSVLGDLAIGSVVKKSDHSARPTAPSTPAASAATISAKPTKPLGPQVDRARRLGKKRSYQDSSFEGYGEGYVDDDAGGYSTGEGESSKLKRRKQNPSNALPYGVRISR